MGETRQSQGGRGRPRRQSVHTCVEDQNATFTIHIMLLTPSECRKRIKRPSVCLDLQPSCLRTISPETDSFAHGDE